MQECRLSAANGQLHVRCDEEECVYWRLVEQIDVTQEPDPQRCAIQHFQLLDGGSDVAEWLLSVKRRMESEEAAGEAS